MGEIPVTESIRSSAELYARQHGWSDNELTHIHRAAKILREDGFSLEVEYGVTDEGDPWCVFCDADSDDILVHFARIGGEYIACTPFHNGALTRRVLRDVVDQFLQRRIGPRLASITLRSPPAA
jgi:hypothetical protein